MNSYIQLFLMFFSFIYGMIVVIMNKWNMMILENRNMIVKIIGNVLYVNNMALIYLLVLYKLNYGEFHIYFLLLILLGFVIKIVKICK